MADSAATPSPNLKLISYITCVIRGPIIQSKVLMEKIQAAMRNRISEGILSLNPLAFPTELYSG
jgi:hypothetical protein